MIQRWTMSIFYLGIVLNIWAQEPRLMVQTGHGIGENYFQATYSPDRKMLLTIGADNTGIIWDLQGRKLLTIKEDVNIKGKNISLNGIAFSDDMKSIITSKEYTKSIGGQVIWGQDITVWSLQGQKLLSFIYDDDIYEKNIEMMDEKGWEYFPDATKNELKKLHRIHKKNRITYIGDNIEFNLLFSSKGELIECDNYPPNANSLPLLSPDQKIIFDEIAMKSRESNPYVFALDFSANGTYILNGKKEHDTTRLELWNLLTGKPSTICAVSPQIGSVIPSPNDNFILTGSEEYKYTSISAPPKLWNLEGETLLSFKGAKGTSPIFSPNGKHILTGCSVWKDWNSPENSIAKLWDLSGKEIQTFDNESFDIHTAAFSPDGNMILIGGGHSGQGTSVPGAGRAILWDLEGRKIQEFNNENYQFMDLTFSPDGKTILTGGALKGFEGVFVSGIAQIWDLSGRKLQDFIDSEAPVSIVRFSPDGQSILTGTSKRIVRNWIKNGTVKMWSISSGELLFQLDDPNITTLTFTEDGKYIISGSSDGTIKLWNSKNGELIATLCTFNQGADWVVTSPDGRFDGNEGGFKNLHYVVGFEAIPLDRFKERYYEPNLLGKIMGFSKQPFRNVQAIEELELYPLAEISLSENKLRVSLKERNGGIGRVALYLGEKEIDADINPKRQKSFTIDLSTYINFFTPNDTNQLSIEVWNDAEWLASNRDLTTFSYAPFIKNLELSSKTRIFALCVGTSNYSGNGLDLSFADQDAQRIAQAIKISGKNLLYDDEGRVSIHILNTDKDQNQWPSKSRIRQVMEDIAKEAKPKDLFILYLSGHGTTNNKDGRDYFYYLTHELNTGNINDDKIRQQYAISSAEFATWINAIPARKQVMILDACASGQFSQDMMLFTQKEIPSSQIRALDRLRSRTGLFIISGSTADQVSYEASPFGQGLLTYSLLHGIKSGEALREEQYVDVLSLFSYAKEKVPELAEQIGGIQEPTIFMPYGAASYDIGLVNQETRNTLVLSDPKPFFSRVRLNNEETFDDDLRLEPILNSQLREFSKMGTQSPFIFVDVADDPNAYRIVGRYRISEEEVTIVVHLKKGQINVSEEFEVTGKKNDLNDLLGKVIKKSYEIVEQK